MKNILFLFILIALFSCKENKINNTKKIDYVNIDDGGDVKDLNKFSKEIDEIGYLYQPERMEQEEIKKNNGKNDYQYTITNSDLLDKDGENLNKYSNKIVGIYYKFLVRINHPFNYDTIIVKIIHRNGKADIFKYSEKEMNEILKEK